MEEYKFKQEYCGLVSLDHMKYMYIVYYDKIAHLQNRGINLSASSLGFKGIVSDKVESNDVSTSSVPKGSIPEFIMYFNKEGYSSYCKDYKDYFDWVEKRNLPIIRIGYKTFIPFSEYKEWEKKHQRNIPQNSEKNSEFEWKNIF